MKNLNVFHEIEKKFRKNSKTNMILKKLRLNQKKFIFKF